MTPVPDHRIRQANEKGSNPDGRYVLYWMTAFRRLGWNFALDHAVDLARELGKPLVILELLRADYPYASPRLHRFMLQGLAERSRALSETPVHHFPFVERKGGAGDGLLPALTAQACCVVGDDYPTFIPLRMASEAGEIAPCRLDLVDSNGLLPLSATDRIFKAAYHFRRYLQKELPGYLGGRPSSDPPLKSLARGGEAVDSEIRERWPPATLEELGDPEKLMEGLPLDEEVQAVDLEGGTGPARDRLETFLREALHRYHEDRNHPDRGATSGLSPYLHFGNLSSHEIVDRVMSREDWTPARLSEKADGSREGWWNMTPGAEAFLDQLVTWRELGFNLSAKTDDFMRYQSLPEWARETLEDHEGDTRDRLYSQEEFRTASTHDPIWNAAQRQLLEEGVIHNYLRMLWGKKILEWTSTPRDALDIMIDLNDRLALDGRDPNSYSGIFWCLGRYDRGWQERPVIGKIRPMSSERTRKKVDMEDYLERFGRQEEE